MNMVKRALKLRGILHGAILSVAILPALLAGNVYAEVSSATLSDFYSVPVLTMESTTPMVVINTSNDHQLYFKAFSDYSDVDGDGIIDTTYAHSIDYYGYFDAYKCYDYDTSDYRFEPKAVTADKYCDSVSGSWSGNFLNWASMARMDVVRKLLFGGKREQPEPDWSTDGYGADLVRVYLPHDAHSFA